MGRSHACQQGDEGSMGNAYALKSSNVPF